MKNDLISKYDLTSDNKPYVLDLSGVNFLCRVIGWLFIIGSFVSLSILGAFLWNFPFDKLFRNLGLY